MGSNNTKTEQVDEVGEQSSVVFHHGTFKSLQYDLVIQELKEYLEGT